MALESIVHRTAQTGGPWEDLFLAVGAGKEIEKLAGDGARRGCTAVQIQAIAVLSEQAKQLFDDSESNRDWHRFKQAYDFLSSNWILEGLHLATKLLFRGR